MTKPLMIITEAFTVGGVETYIRGEIDALVAQGREVHLVCGEKFEDALVPDSVTSVTHGISLGPESTIDDLLRSVDAIRALVREKGIGAIHAHPFTSIVPALIAAESEGISLILTLHGPSSVVGSYGPAYDFVQSTLVLPGASLVLAVSDEIARLAQPYVASGRLKVQPNAIEDIGSAPSVQGELQSERWLVVSRLDQDKSEGIAQFVRAAHLAGVPGVAICGSGDPGYVQELLGTDVPADFTEWLGARTDVAELMRSHAGVAGMGRVALEGVLHAPRVFLIGYDKLGGLLDEALYRLAEFANLSGRGVPALSVENAADQLRDRTDTGASAALRSVVMRERCSESIWGAFSRQIDKLPPLQPGIGASLIEHLRAAGGNAGASAFWSPEVMDALGRLIAAQSKDDPSAALSYALYSSAFVRFSVEHRLAEALHAVNANAEALEHRVRHEVASHLSSTSLADEALSAVELGVAELKREIVGQRQDLEAQTQEIRLHRSDVQRGIAELQRQVVDQRNDLNAFALQLQSHRAEISQGLAAMGEDFKSHVGAALHAFEAQLASETQRLAMLLDHGSALTSDVARLKDEVARANAELSKVYASSSWLITRPLRVAKRLLTHPVDTSRYLMSRMQPSPLQTSRRTWGARFPRVRSALNFARRVVVNRRIERSDKTRIATMIRVRLQRAQTLLGFRRTRPAVPALPALADVYVWAVIDWHFRTQRPQHLATALAKKGHRVFYISNNFIDAQSAGFVTEDLGCEGRLFQVNLNVAGAPQIYADMPDEARVAQIQASLQELIVWAGSTKCISFVQHPYWFEPSRCLPNSQLIYDCMDHHGGFENNASSILAGERSLIQACDLLVVTSQWLHEELAPEARNIALIRNATEYSHFCTPPAKHFRDPKGRRVIGYYGAIAEWFDVALVRAVAIANPDALVLLVGHDTVEAGKALADLQNVQMVGEVPYADLPFWLYGFDVCLLPFQVIPLTLATNPVKVYEYLSAGKPVVSVDLPELAQFDGLVYLAGDEASFVAATRKALDEQGTSSRRAMEQRRAFAAKQTWAHRAADLDAVLDRIPEPLVSVVVLTYNNLDYTKQCLDSLERYSDYPNLEVIVVDNASSDGSQQYLADWAKKKGVFKRTFIANPANVGFSAGNNIGLAQANGEYLVVLNNDTYVSPGWVRTMIAHLRKREDVGLVGPVTNNIGNEAKIEIVYGDMEDMVQAAGDYTRRRAGVAFPMATAAFFCVMLTRRAYEVVGGLDERFGIGFFEDDDYCRRLAAEGFGVLCAEDVFVHHHLSASFAKLDNGVRQQLFERNKAAYEEKWGEWKPHRYREG